MKTSRRLILLSLFSVLIFSFAEMSASSQTTTASTAASTTATVVSSVANPCPRPAAGSVVHNPTSLFSSNGVLNVNFSYQTRTDADGRTLYCFMTPDGLQNPTLHVRPGDTLTVNVTNNVPASSGMVMVMSSSTNVCGSATQTATSLNIHYHGTNTSPNCHSDEVIHTLINSGQSFKYTIQFPTNEPPGLYWYHPHVHGIAESAVQGGASGAIIVDGIQYLQPAVAGLRHRVLMIRDQNVAGSPTPGGSVPSWDLTVNNIPIAFPALTPAVMHMQSGEKQLWRVSNSSADSIVDLQVQFDGTPQNLGVVALDGVPTGSQDGTRQGKIVNTNHILIPTAGRAEFIVAAPASTVKNAILVTQPISTGPLGDNDTGRTLAIIKTFGSDNDGDGDNDDAVSTVVGTPWAQRFEGVQTATPTVQRTLYFSEVLSDPTNPLSPTNFFITVDGATPVLFDPTNPPAITTHQGSIEQWVVQNRAQENHEFHFHQIHFQVKSQNNFEVNGTPQNTVDNGQFMDMVQVPFWDGNASHPYPSVTLQFDFTGPDVGDFVYHCHILGHEDNGMMAIIRVLPN
ncbi:MAG TPA: multicopper oxidase domain-containing protein [Candidatus Angelobacter sp.]|nr:multicopper oxidase domain-containing protein [Candidatus Angelobacter sp.]